MAERRKQIQDQIRAELPDGVVHNLKCGECGHPMIPRMTERYKYKSGKPRIFYSCSMAPACTGSHGAHPDGSPLGIPGDTVTKKYRSMAHEQFDRLWKHGHLSRPQSYRFLQFLMGMTKDEAHIGRFNKLQCERLIQLIKCGVADVKLEEFLNQ